MSRFFLGYFLVCLVIQFDSGYSLKRSRNLNSVNFIKHLEHAFLGRSTPVKDNICCANGRWEANAYVYANTLFTLQNVTMPVYYNGTGKIAFDEVNKKSYISFSVRGFLPGEPQYYNKTSTTIKDYATGATYSIDDDNCFKEPYTANMSIVCIPQDAKQISDGVFGGTDVETYQFITTDSLETITTASVLRNGSYCETVMISYVMVAEGDTPEQFMYNVDIVDISHGIKDPSIFKIPKICN